MVSALCLRIGFLCAFAPLRELFFRLTGAQVRFEDAAIFFHVHVALAADEHERPVGAEVAVPLHDLLVGPGGIVLRQMLIRQARQVTA